MGNLPIKGRGDVMRKTTYGMHTKRTRVLATVLIGLVCISFMSHPVGAWMRRTDTVSLGSAYGGYFEMQIYRSFWGDEVVGKLYFWNYPYNQTMIIPDGYLGKICIHCDGSPTDKYTFIDNVSDEIRYAAKGASCGAASFWCGQGSVVCIVIGLSDGPYPVVDFFCYYWVSYKCASNLYECLN